MMDRKRLVAAGAALVSLLAWTACGGDDTAGGSGGDRPHIAFVTNCVASFWVIGKAGALKAGEDLDVKVTVEMPTGGQPDQKAIVEDMLTRGVDGLAISLIDPDNQTGFVNSACAQTNVITHDSDAPKSERLCYIGVDNYTAGRSCGELVREALPDGGTICLFVGRMEQDNARGRRQGIIDAVLGRSVDPKRFDPPGQPIQDGKYTFLQTYTDEIDETKAKDNAADALTNYPELDCMVGLFAYNTPAILEALKQVGKQPGDVRVVAFDEADGTLEGIRSGWVHGTVVQDPYAYGYESVRMLKALANGDRSVLPEGGYKIIPERKIKRAEVDAYWADLKAKMAAAGG